MDIKLVLVLVAVAIMLVVIISYATSPLSTLTTMTDGKTAQTVKSEDLAGSDSGSTTTNFAYGIWFYIDDWNYKYGEPKILFARSGKDAPESDSSSSDNSDTSSKSYSSYSSGSDNNKGSSSSSSTVGGPPEPCPAVIFAPIENNLTVKLTCYNAISGANDQTVIHNCAVPNIPLQKWTHLLISVYGRSMDVYMDGKLVKTCMLPGVPKVSASLPVIVTPMGGFSGWTSNFQYWNDSINPQQAWDTYKKGYGENFLSSIFSKYSIKLSVMDGDVEKNSVTL